MDNGLGYYYGYRRICAPIYLGLQYLPFSIALTIIALLINLAVGFRMLVANREYLRGLDEMQQKILFNAMAFTLGVGLVLGLSYELLEDIKLISFEPEISHLIMVMCLTNLTAIIAGHRKYR